MHAVLLLSSLQHRKLCLIYASIEPSIANTSRPCPITTSLTIQLFAGEVNHHARGQREMRQGQELQVGVVRQIWQQHLLMHHIHF